MYRIDCEGISGTNYRHHTLAAATFSAEQLAAHSLIPGAKYTIIDDETNIPIYSYINTDRPRTTA